MNSTPIIFIMLLVSFSLASSSFPKYTITPTAPDTTDSVSFFIAKGMFPNSCVPVYLTSFTITPLHIVCKSAAAPCPDYSISIAYDSAARWMDSLIQDRNNNIESVWQYEYNNDTVYYFLMGCCDFFNLLYGKNGVFLCAPDGGYSGHGDGKCPDFFEKSKNKKLVWEYRRTSVTQGTILCGQVLTEYGPRFNFGKLPAGDYVIVDQRNSSQALLNFYVTKKKSTAARESVPQAQAAVFSVRRTGGSVAFTLAMAQHVSFAAYRLDGQQLFQSERQCLASGVHHIDLHVMKDKMIIFHIKGDGFSKAILLNGAQ